MDFHSEQIEHVEALGRDHDLTKFAVPAWERQTLRGGEPRFHYVFDCLHGTVGELVGAATHVRKSLNK